MVYIALARRGFRKRRKTGGRDVGRIRAEIHLGIRADARVLEPDESERYRAPFRLADTSCILRSRDPPEYLVDRTLVSRRTRDRDGDVPRYAI